jgi:hypothetical protein
MMGRRFYSSGAKSFGSRTKCSMIENANAFNELKIVWEKCYRWFCENLGLPLISCARWSLHPNG